MAAGWHRRPATWVALGIFLVSLVVYVLTMARTTSFWDCGEFIACSHILGIPHQPGTPLYVLVGRCFDILLGGMIGVAASINFMSAFFSSLALAFLYLVVRDIARRADPDTGWIAHAGGAIGAFFLLFSQTYWNNAVEAEVYGLTAFMLSFLTWLALRWHERRGDEKRGNSVLYLLFYLLGLGVGFHLGSLLVYPGIFVLILISRDRKLPVVDLFAISFGLALFFATTVFKDGFVLWTLYVVYGIFVLWRALRGHPFALAASGLFMLGLSVHLYLFVRAGLDPAINQSQPDTLGNLMAVIRREQYPPMNPFARKADLGWQIGYYYNYLMDQFYFIGPPGSQLSRVTTFLGPVFLGLLGLIHGFWRARPMTLMLIVNYFINADLLNLYLNFSDSEVRERDYFFFAAFLFFAVLIGLGAAALLRYMAGPLGRGLRELKSGERLPAVRAGWVPRAAAIVLVALAALPALVPGHVKWFEHDRSGNQVAREYAWNILAGLDRDAILFTNGDNDTFPIWYLQYVEGFRTDVTVVNLSLINLSWYIRQLRDNEPGLPLSFTDEEIDRLQPVLYENPNTGEQRLVWVKDYIVDDVIRQAFGKRSLFFAVTVPHDNMERYLPLLQMEGLTYRVTANRSDDGMPSVDGERLLTNVVGVYDFTAILDGDTQQRRLAFAEDNGAPAPLAPADTLPGPRPRSIVMERALSFAGQRREDIYIHGQTGTLLGNYPNSLVAAGYNYLRRAQETAVDDDAGYERLLGMGAGAFELAAGLEPLYPLVVDFYPMILVEKDRSDEAVAYVESIRGRVPPQDEMKVLANTASAMISVGDGDVAAAWMESRIAVEPTNKVYYQLLFKYYRTVIDIAGCRDVMERWRIVTGSPVPDSEMAAVVAEMEAAAGSGPAAGETP